MKKYIFYRITSKLNQKSRVENFSKLGCLESLIYGFPDYKIICVADNCDHHVLKTLEEKKFFKLIKTKLGNAASFNYLINFELPQLSDDDLIYFAEDDYLYRTNSYQVLEEGLKYFDYVTLYDHPDKYGNYPLDRNLLIPNGVLSEFTQIIKGSRALWRTTNSTTMTFGCYAKTMKKDYKIWNMMTKKFNVPRDFYIWILLTCPQKNFFTSYLNLSIILIISNLLFIFRGKRLLGVSTPSYAAHLELGMTPDNFYNDFIDLKNNEEKLF